MKTSSYSRAIAVFLCAALFINNVLLARAPEKNFWEQKKLAALLPHIPNNLPDNPQLNRHSRMSRFLEAVNLESWLDFAAMKKERARLLSKLIRRLSQQQQDTLMNTGVAYRLGQISDKDFHEFLSTLCAGGGLPLAAFPAMYDYIRTEKLANFSLTRTEWVELHTVTPEKYATLADEAEGRGEPGPTESVIPLFAS